MYTTTSGYELCFYLSVPDICAHSASYSSSSVCDYNFFSVHFRSSFRKRNGMNVVCMFLSVSLMCQMLGFVTVIRREGARNFGDQKNGRV